MIDDPDLRRRRAHRAVRAAPPGRRAGQIYGRAGVVGAVDSSIPVDLHTYAVLGAAASLGGATRMTISITVLVMETTG